MGRAPVIVAIGVCCVTGIVPAAAQPPAADGWVVLPVEEYRTLRERSLGLPAPPAASPVDATLTRVDYELRGDGNSIDGRALLTVDVLREGWARVPIPPGLMVRDATVDGQPVALVEEGPAHLLLSRSGRSQVVLDLVVPITSAAGTESIALPASPAPITRTTLTLPRGGVELTVNGGFVGERAEAADESRWIVFGRPAEALTLAWKRRIDDRRAELPLRIRARVAQFVGLGEDTSQVLASVRVEVMQGLAQDVALALPPGFVVNQVNGATVADWQTADGTLRVRLLEPASAEASFVVQGEVKSPRDGTITVPLVRVPTAERETGGVAVDVLGAGEIAGRQARGLEPAPPSELGDIVAGRESPSMIAFRLRPLAGTEPRGAGRHGRALHPAGRAHRQRRRGALPRARVRRRRLLVEARYAVRNNQRSFLKVTLPPKARRCGARRSAAVPIRPGVAEQDAVLLPLEKGRAGRGSADLRRRARVSAAHRAPGPKKGRRSIALPALDLPMSRTGLELHYSPRFRVELQPGTFLRLRTPGRSPKRSESGRCQPAGATSAGSRRPRSLPPGCRASSIASATKPAERTVVGALPVDVTFPAFGPSIFLASELTAEARPPVGRSRGHAGFRTSRWRCAR